MLERGMPIAGGDSDEKFVEEQPLSSPDVVSEQNDDPAANCDDVSGANSDDDGPARPAPRQSRRALSNHEIPEFVAKIQTLLHQDLLKRGVQPLRLFRIGYELPTELVQKINAVLLDADSHSPLGGGPGAFGFNRAGLFLRQVGSPAAGSRQLVTLFHLDGFVRCRVVITLHGPPTLVWNGEKVIHNTPVAVIKEDTIHATPWDEDHYFHPNSLEPADNVATVGDTAFDRLWLVLDDPKKKIDPQ